MTSEPFGASTFPTTVAELRRARIRAAALATVPFVLFLVAAIPRWWAPDLVPFGDRQAAYVLEARSRTPVSPAMWYADLTVPALALVEPLLRPLPSPVAAWVVVRGLLDALGVALLYLAARRVVGVAGGIVAALLYAFSPTAWAASRDPAGPLGALVAAATLLGAVLLAARPTLLRGAVFGVLLGLLARSVPAGLVVVLIGVTTLGVLRASWRVWGVSAIGLAVIAGPAFLLSSGGTWLDGVMPTDVARVPGWLVLGIAYAPFEGQAPGTTLFLDGEWWLGPLLLSLMVGAAVVGLLDARVRRVHASIVVMLVSLVAAACIVLPTKDLWQGFFPWGITPALEGGALVAAVPALCLTFALFLTVRHRGVRWVAPIPVVVVLLVEVLTLGRSLVGVEQSPQFMPEVGGWRRPGARVNDPEEDLGGIVGTETTLRRWTALADAVRDVTSRLQTDTIVSAPDQPLMAVLGDGVAIRRLNSAIVLPLSDETVYVTRTGYSPNGELARPSSTQAVFTSFGADTGARILTLRPRTATDWLAHVQAVPDGRFADGSTLLGIGNVSARDRDSLRTVSFRLYWRLPGAPDSASVAARMVVESPGMMGMPALFGMLPEAAERREDEIVVKGYGLNIRPPERGSVLEIGLRDASGAVIPTATGAPSLRVTLPGIPE